MPELDRPALDTPRLRLRPLRAGDESALYETFSDPQVMRYWSTPPWDSMAPAEAMVAYDQGAMAGGDHLRLGLERREDTALIGTCTLFGIHGPSRRAEIGYALRASAWGRGYMHEALQALLAYGFGPLALNRVEADIDPRNAASARALQRLGFVEEGRLRERWIVAGEASDSALYGLLARDWQARAGA